MIDDPVLNYVALGILVLVVVVLFYGTIAIHDIPARIAASRHHPHEDAIHAAGWVSLFTLHVLWPFLWIWAMAYKPDRGWGFHHSGEKGEEAEASGQDELADLRRRIEILEAQSGSNAKPAFERGLVREPTTDSANTSTGGA